MVDLTLIAVGDGRGAWDYFSGAAAGPAPEKKTRNVQAHHHLSDLLCILAPRQALPFPQPVPRTVYSADPQHLPLPALNDRLLVHSLAYAVSCH